jgi:hypothetical protein
MYWVALTPLLLLGLAVGLVPVIMGMVHDDRARRAGAAAFAHHFFVPSLARAVEPRTEVGPRQDIEQRHDVNELNLSQRVERIEAKLAHVLAQTDAGPENTAPEGA